MKRSDYLQIHADAFPEKIEIRFMHNAEVQTMLYHKQQWNGKGLRYGDNPDQEAACYTLYKGETLPSYVSTKHAIYASMQLLHGAKQPSKTNIGDINTALEILRYLNDTPCAVIVKHNNPSSVAADTNIETAYRRAYQADCIAAFGGALCVNRPVDRQAAAAIMEQYLEVIAAPAYDSSALELLSTKKNLRIFLIPAIEHLSLYNEHHYLDFSSLLDGGFIVQRSFYADLKSIAAAEPARAVYKDKEYRIQCKPTEAERKDMYFGWCVQSAISSNSILYVRNQCTVGIAAGEQDRLGAATLARDKAYRNMREYLAQNRFSTNFSVLESNKQKEVENIVQECSAGLQNSVVISDGFFPFRDALDIPLLEGASAVLQPGGSIRDFECIQACNETGASMIFTRQRGFRH